MAKWVKNVYEWALNGTNMLTTRIVHEIIDMYGSRLLNMSNQDIINRVETLTDENVFYFKDLQLNNIQYDAGDCIVVLQDILVSNACIRVPWRHPWSSTVVVEAASITAGFHVTTPPCMTTSISDMSSYLRDREQNPTVTSLNLEQVTHEIASMLSKVFQKIEIKISIIQLSDVESPYQILIHTIRHKNHVTNIQKIICRELHTAIAEISCVDCTQECIDIESVELMRNIFDMIQPFIHSRPSQKTHMVINIKNLTIDELKVQNFTFAPTGLNVENVKLADWCELKFRFVAGDMIAKYDATQNIWQMLHPIDVYFQNISATQEWIANFMKLSFFESLPATKATIIDNLHLNLEYMLYVSEVKIQRCLFHDTIVLTSVVWKTEFMKLEVMRLIKKADVWYFDKGKITSNMFAAQADKISYRRRCLTFLKADSTSTMSFVTYVLECRQNLENWLLTTDTDSNTSAVDNDFQLILIKSVLQEPLYQTSLTARIQTAEINLTQHKAQKIQAEILLAKQLFFQIKINSFSKTEINVESIIFFADQELVLQLKKIWTQYTAANDVAVDVEIVATDDYQTAFDVASDQSYIQNQLPTEPIIIQNHIPAVIIDDYEKSTSELTTLKLEITEASIYLHDKIKNYQEIFRRSFFKAGVKNLTFCVSQQQHDSDKRYKIVATDFHLLDLAAHHPQWSRFLELNHNESLQILIKQSVTSDNALKISIHVGTMTAHIREVMVAKLKSFFDVVSGHNQKTDHITKITSFSISSIWIKLDYLPIIIGIPLEGDVFSITDYEIFLSQQTVYNATSIEKIAISILENWQQEFQPKNVIQFIPNIRVIKPVATPVLRWVDILVKVFARSS